MSQLRILAGSAKGRALIVPSSARPSAAMLRKSLFDLLANQYGEGARLLDLFAGAGAIGLEAASRGYNATLVERDLRAAQAIEANRRTLGLEGKVLRMDARRFIEAVSEPYDVVFVDPPYSQDIAAITSAALANERLVEAEGVLIVQAPASLPLPPAPPRWRLERRQYGTNSLSLYWRE